MEKNPVGRPREVMSKKRIGKRVRTLRKAGLSFGKIGRALSISRQRAHWIYRRVLAELGRG